LTKIKIGEKLKIREKIEIKCLTLQGNGKMEATEEIEKCDSVRKGHLSVTLYANDDGLVLQEIYACRQYTPSNRRNLSHKKDKDQRMGLFYFLFLLSITSVILTNKFSLRGFSTRIC
jgi:hypothetical protein